MVGRSSARAALDAVLESFRAVGVPAPPAGEPPWSAAELGEIAHARELFVAAGTERVVRALGADRWLQVGVRCASDAQADAFLAGPLDTALRRWSEAGTVGQFFFMRKPPGVRLRFRGTGLDTTLLPELLALLAGEEAAKRITGHELGVYDEETHQFGGEVGLEIAHEHFDHDSRALFEIIRLEAQDADTTDRETLSLLVLNDLVAQVASDGWERWDVWRNMRLAGRLRTYGPEAEAALRGELEANHEALLQTLHPREALAKLPPAEQKVLERYFAANTKVAARFADAARAGTLLYGARKILPFFVIFHWNRWGMDATTQFALTYFMESLQSPKGE
jgi:thiopeptide-type bacteriocin biosynthesis protein